MERGKQGRVVVVVVEVVDEEANSGIICGAVKKIVVKDKYKSRRRNEDKESRAC